VRPGAYRCFTRVGFSLTCKHETRLKRLARTNTNLL
jgi:hypothetical protein